MRAKTQTVCMLSIFLFGMAAQANVPFTPGKYLVLDLLDGKVSQVVGVDSPTRFRNDVYKDSRIAFRVVPKTTIFKMQQGAEPVQFNPTVSFPKAYAIAVYPLTQMQYSYLRTWVAQYGQTLPELQPQNFGLGDHKPAHFLSQQDSLAIANAVAASLQRINTGNIKKISAVLPNEAQWECAARAGSTTKWFFGSSANGLDDYACFNDGGASVQDVGGKLPNQWGLYDVYGNVKEWCTDIHWPWFTYGDATYADGWKNQPGGYGNGVGNGNRIFRGGAANSGAEECSSTFRGQNPPNDRYNTGLRLVLEPRGSNTTFPSLDEEVPPVLEAPWDNTTVYPAAEPAAGSCAPTFTIDRVQQHYPWDGKIDIHYTLSGVDSSRFHALYFTATGGGKSMTIFVKDRGGPSDPTGLKDEVLARDGSHCYIWDLLEAATNSTQCANNAAVTTLTNVFARGTAKVTGRIVDTGAPVKVLRGDYKILDIASGAVTSMTDADPLQFNTAEYKTTKIAFRRIAARPSMKVMEDFYIAVFPLTMAQTRNLNNGTMPRTYSYGWRWNSEGQEETVTGPDGNQIQVVHTKVRTGKISAAPYKGDYWWQWQTGEEFPMNRISYNDIRGTADNRVSEARKGNLGNNEDGDPSLFLKYKNAHGVVLDLPDGFEWELAARGNTTYRRWFFGDDDVNMGYYAWYWDNSLPYTCIKCLNRVGLRYPNQFGLWDVYGNAWQMCRNYLNNTWEPEYSQNYPTPRELRGGTSFFRSQHASHYRPYPLEIGGYPGEEFGGSYNWEGYHFYGFRPILVSHN